MRAFSDYSDNFKGRERAEENFWVQKHEREMAEMKKDTIPPELIHPQTPAHGTLMYSHQTNKVIALEELEDIFDAYPSLSESLPHDLKRALVTWKVDALYRISSGNPHDFAPKVAIDGSMTVHDQAGSAHKVLPPEYAPTWLFEHDPTEYKLQRYAYEKMQFDYDVEPLERIKGFKDTEEYKQMKKKVVDDADFPFTTGNKKKPKKP